MIITKSNLILSIVLSLFISSSHADEHYDGHGHEHESQLFHALWFEAQHGGGSEGDKTHIEWDGWIGGDYHKLWLKGELEGHKGKLEQSEVWALYSRNVHDFWDAQLGLRVDTQPESTRYLTLGFNGLAPYLFETQAHLFISDYGDVSARLKQKNHLLFTQRFGFEPYYQLDFTAQNVERQELGRGLSEGEIGVKLFYEITRKVVPYLDLKYERKFGRTASIARNADENEEDWIASVGIKLLF